MDITGIAVKLDSRSALSPLASYLFFFHSNLFFRHLLQFWNSPWSWTCKGNSVHTINWSTLCNLLIDVFASKHLEERACALSITKLRIEDRFGYRTFLTKFCNILKYGMNFKFEIIVEIFRKKTQLKAVIILKYYRKNVSKSGRKIDVYSSIMANIDSTLSWSWH